MFVICEMTTLPQGSDQSIDDDRELRHGAKCLDAAQSLREIERGA
jgi:hypothetical protein